MTAPTVSYALLRGHETCLDGSDATGLVQVQAYHPVRSSGTNQIISTQPVERPLVHGEWECLVPFTDDEALDEPSIVELHLLLDGTRPDTRLLPVHIEDVTEHDDEGRPVVYVSDIAPLAEPPEWLRMADLRDVEATDLEVPSVLVRGADGVYRSVALADITTGHRGSVIHYLVEDPAGVPEDAEPGDWVTVIAGPRAGTIYEVQEA